MAWLACLVKVALLALCSSFLSHAPPACADATPQPVELRGIEGIVYGLAVDEETGIVYLKSVPERDRFVMARMDPSNPLILTRIADQSPLDEVNRLQPVSMPHIAAYGGSKYLYFVRNERAIGGEKPDIVAARWEEGKWVVREDLQSHLVNVNSPGLEAYPFIAEEGKAIYFSSDSDRDRRTCDPFMQFLSGFCLRVYKATRTHYDEPFQLKGDGNQVTASGCVDLFHDECSWPAAAAAVSEAGVMFFNGPPLPGWVDHSFDEIYRAEPRGDGWLDHPLNMMPLNVIKGMGIKEFPYVTPSGRDLYWFSGKYAHRQRPYHIGLASLEDKDKDGFDSSVDGDDRNPAVYPGAPETMSTRGVDNDCDVFADDVDLYVSVGGKDQTGCGERSSPCKTLQYAINAAAHGSIVYVEPGLYEEDIKIARKWISLVSTEGPLKTTIQGVKPRTPTVEVVGFRKWTPMFLKGFTIMRGREGGLRISNSQITVENNIICGNQATKGGGILINNAHPRIIHNVIADNNAGVGGGIYVQGGEYDRGVVLTIRDNIVINNSGGGIFLNKNYRDRHKTPPIIERNDVWNNREYNIGACRACDLNFLQGKNFSVDPQFEEGSFRLKKTSPLQGRGSSYHADRAERFGAKTTRRPERGSGSRCIGLLEGDP